MTDSSNTEVDSQVGESTKSETTSNSNGNFSGGFDSSALSNESFSKDSTPDFGIDFGPNNNSGSFDFSYNPFDGSDFDFVNGLSGDSDSSKTSETYNKSEPVMTVDEVYGKGNQSIVESQGDYTASSNEKSNVETSTFGKQDEISVTPTFVTEDKGLVNNDAIQSVEGLNFQQKDKANQDVMEAKKSRDEAEAEDKAQSMRDKIRNINKEAQNEENVLDFTIGKETNKAEQEALDKATADVNKELSNQGFKSAEEAQQHYDDVSKEMDRLQQAYQNRQDQLNVDYGQVIETKDALIASGASTTDPDQTYMLADGSVTNTYNVPSMGTAGIKSMATYTKQKEATEAYNKAVLDVVESDKKAKEAFDTMTEYDKNTFQPTKKNAEKLNGLIAAQTRAQENFDKSFVSETPKAEVTEADAKAKVDKATEAYNNAFVGAETSTSDTKQTFDNAIKNAVEKGADEQTVQAMTNTATAIEKAQTSMKDAIAANDIPTYIEAQKQYNGLLEDALKIGNRLTQTDYNKPFVEAVAKANDFKVTLADGTIKDYSQFATEMVTKSPEIAKAMYEAKADKLETDGHKVLAKIERAKASMVGTWIGSKLTRADNQVRNQFNQMAKTDMRATYAAYNNVLKDPNATTEQKAEASAAINQANSLMTASAALQASTGFFSGIGDSMKDGVYGTTKPGDLNAYQKTLNTVDNLCKITLGLGVTPGANKAYQNMYYMAGAEVNESGLFSKDWDGDGFALCQEYGNNAAAGMIAGAGELATGTALFFNPAMSGIGLNLVIDSVQTFINGLYGVQKDARKSQQYTQEVLSYFEEAEDIAEQSGNKEAVDSISNGITQIENFQLKSDEVGNLDNWLEGSGSNTADNGKFNQALTYDEWLKLIKADPVMQEYAKSLNR